MTQENYDNYHQQDRTSLAQVSQLANWRWEGAPVIELKGTISELYPKIPIFSRHPFRSGGEENRYKDEIHREPLKITEDPLPVATVTKTYALIQHRDLLASVFRALRMIHIDISEVDSTIHISEYGERLQWSCAIPNYDFDPGDGYPVVLRVNCLNSVDMTTVLEFALSWYRLICANGLMFGMRDSLLRRRHVQSLDPGEIAGYLEDQLKRVPGEQKLYQDWFKRRVTPPSLIEWLDDQVAKKWGLHAAARVWHVVTAGTDGDVQPANNRKPHELQLKSSREVPGVCAPVSNLFHVSQALSWIAGTRANVQERLQYIKDIPILMEPLASRRA